jgi:riboflavin synthase alpha subunit
MFTGLVREVGRLESVRISGERAGLEISAPHTAPGLRVGDSLAVNGVCLTVTVAAGARVRADVSAETRRVTTVSNWRAGDRVHIEPALRVGDAVGGHFVLGHVDGVGRVRQVARLAGGLAITVSAAPVIADQLLPKGSIAVDGVSLTLDEGPFIGTFTVTLIPHTLRETRFAALGTGDLVNLEVDVLSKAARRVARPGTPRAASRAGTLTVEAIAARGWTGGRGEGIT